MGLEDDFVEMMKRQLVRSKNDGYRRPSKHRLWCHRTISSTFVRKHMQLMEPTADDDLSAYTIVDVREADEFEGPLGHLPTAELVPLAELSSKMRRGHPKQNCCWCAAVVLGQHRHARFYWMPFPT